MQLDYTVKKWQDGNVKNILINGYSKIKDVTFIARLDDSDCKQLFDCSDNIILKKIKDKKLIFAFTNCEFIRKYTKQKPDFSFVTKERHFIICPGSNDYKYHLERSEFDDLKEYMGANIFDVVDEILDDLEDITC